MIGSRIRLLRKEKKWNQTELAKRIGVGRTTITSYEVESITPSYDKILLMSEIFGVSVDYLTGKSNSRVFEVNDINDFAEQINGLIDQLNNQDIVLNLNGKTMNLKTRKFAAEQLIQLVKLFIYLNNLE